MRVTNQMMADSIIVQLSRQTEQIAKTQEQISTGKSINRPSDAPAEISSVLSFRASIASLEQYNENISNAKLHIDTVEDVLEIVSDLLGEAKEIAYDTAPSQRSEMAEQVASIREQVLQMANYQISGKYLFAGDATLTQPYDSSTWLYNGDAGTKDIIIGENAQLSITADGSSIFGADGDNVFNILNDLESALDLSDAAAIEDQIERLDSAIDTITTVRARNASVYQRLEATENYNDTFKLNLQEMLSNTEDADITEAIISYQVQQTAYESNLSVSAMIIQKSLIDFLA